MSPTKPIDYLAYVDSQKESLDTVLRRRVAYKVYLALEVAAAGLGARGAFEEETAPVGRGLWTAEEGFLSALGALRRDTCWKPSSAGAAAGAAAGVDSAFFSRRSRKLPLLVEEVLL